jgi:hypothetical protein
MKTSILLFSLLVFFCFLFFYSLYYQPIESFDTQTSSNANKEKLKDTYNHYEQSLQSDSPPPVFSNVKGDVFTMTIHPDGTKILQLTKIGETLPQTFYSQKEEDEESQEQEKEEEFYSVTDNMIAKLITDEDGKKKIELTLSNGEIIEFNTNQTSALSSTQYYGSTGNQIQNNDLATVSNPTTSNPYETSLPQGIPKSMIPSGNEDLYILKSQIIPPICPACQTISYKKENHSCPPCPACERCPEPSFTCKKVPNYNTINENKVPLPMLPNFSSF